MADKYLLIAAALKNAGRSDAIRLLKSGTEAERAAAAARMVAEFLGGRGPGGTDPTLIRVEGRRANAYMNVEGLPSDADTFILCNETFTCVTSDDLNLDNEFYRKTTNAAQITEYVRAINANTRVNKKVESSVVASSVRIDALLPGEIGNGLQFSESLDNCSIEAFYWGRDGSICDLNQR